MTCWASSPQTLGNPYLLCVAENLCLTLAWLAAFGAYTLTVKCPMLCSTWGFQAHCTLHRPVVCHSIPECTEDTIMNVPTATYLSWVFISCHACTVNVHLVADSDQQFLAAPVIWTSSLTCANMALIAAKNWHVPKIASSWLAVFSCQ